PIMAFGGTRVVQQTWRLGEWDIPAGTAVANAMSMVHRRSDLYPDPLEFKPERFLGKRPDPYEWTPFGGGVRRCLGMAFALYEMKIVLARLLSSVELELADDGPARDARLLHRTGEGASGAGEGTGCGGLTSALRRRKGRPRREARTALHFPACSSGGYCVTLSEPTIEGCTAQW